MVNPGASLCCPLLLVALNLFWGYAPNLRSPAHEGQVQKCIVCIKGLKYKYAFYTEAYSHLLETTPAEQRAAPRSGKNKSPFNLLQTRDSNVHMLLLVPGCQTGFLLQYQEVVYRQRPG